MRRVLLIFLLVTMTLEVLARAGGGGSYRSSSSSSSRSSSSSSSRSSSSSSYRSSSSSGSSYRPSSSSRSSSYSGSSYRAPDYTTTEISRVNSYNADLQLLPDGRLRVKERITMAISDKNPKNIYIRKIVPPGEIASLVSIGSYCVGCTIDNRANDSLNLKFYAYNKAGLAEFELNYTLLNSTVPLAKPKFTFYPGLSASSTSLRFASAFAAETIQLIERPDSVPKVASVVASAAGTQANFAPATGLREASLVATFSQATAQTMQPAFKNWQVIHASLDATLSVDSIMTLNYTISGVQAKEAALRFPEDERYLLGEVRNFSPAPFRKYYETPMMTFLDTQATARFNISPLYEDATTRSSEIPLPNLSARSPRLADSFAQKPAITIYDSITINLPAAGVATLWRCGETWSYSGCGSKQPMPLVSKAEGNRLLVTIPEPVTSVENVIRISLPVSAIKDMGFFRSLLFGYRHYGFFGNRPGWIDVTRVLLVLVLLIVATIVIVKTLGALKRRRLARQEEKRREQERAALKKTEDAAVRIVLSHDPAFDIEAFRKRGMEIAQRIQHSWCAGDMADCRRFLSQGVYNRFRLQLRIMRELEKRRNMMADFRIHNFYVLASVHSGPFDCLVVRMDAEARDTMVKVDASDEQALNAARHAALQPFTEFYSFMRRRNAKTEHSGNLDSCSHCGTPFAAEGETNKCKSCGAVMGAGEFDWVLAEITQNSEYRGVTERRDLPEGTSADRVEDRASFVFWRYIWALQHGKKDYLLRDATDGLLDKGITTEKLFDIAVGAAELEAISDKGNANTARVRIKWSAAKKAQAEPRHRESVITLLQPAGVSSGQGFADPGCPTCGAPLPETDSDTCAYCRSTIARKNPDWLLDSIETTVE